MENTLRGQSNRWVMFGVLTLCGLYMLLVSNDCFAFELGADDFAKKGYDFMKDKVTKNVGALAITGAGLFVVIAGFGEKIKGLIGNYAGYVGTAVGVTAGTPLVLTAAGYML